MRVLFNVTRSRLSRGYPHWPGPPRLIVFPEETQGFGIRPSSMSTRLSLKQLITLLGGGNVIFNPKKLMARQIYCFPYYCHENKGQCRSTSLCTRASIAIATAIVMAIPPWCPSKPRLSVWFPRIWLPSKPWLRPQFLRSQALNILWRPELAPRLCLPWLCRGLFHDRCIIKLLVN